MNKNVFWRVIIILGIYLLLRQYGGEWGEWILYPVFIFVTFLHELGHALLGVLTGGKVLAIQISPDGSGYTTTQGGIAPLILMGGYVGSAILGNLLFYIGAKRPRLATMTLRITAVWMVLMGIFWFNSMISSTLLIAFAILLYFVTEHTPFQQEVLTFLGLASVAYIIRDFRVGPSSDLTVYANLMPIFTQQMWMYLWLIIVILITGYTLKKALK